MIHIIMKLRDADIIVIKILMNYFASLQRVLII